MVQNGELQQHLVLRILWDSPISYLQKQPSIILGMEQFPWNTKIGAIALTLCGLDDDAGSSAATL